MMHVKFLEKNLKIGQHDSEIVSLLPGNKTSVVLVQEKTAESEKQICLCLTVQRKKATELGAGEQS